MLLRCCLAIVLLVSFGARPTLAEIATIDVLFDLDQDSGTGCSVVTSEGPAPGIELRLRSLVDTDTDAVTSVSSASCIDAVADTFGSETPLPVGPFPSWSTVPGEGASGSTLVETHLPLEVSNSSGLARVFVSVSSPSGADALLSVDGGGGAPILLTLAPAVVPALGTGVATVLVFLLGALGLIAIRGEQARRGVAVGLLLLAATFGPMAVRAGLGDGVLRIWAAEEEVASDLAGDAPVGIDLLNLFASVNTVHDRLWLRMDLFFDPAICLDWGTVSAGSGYSCVQQPPPDQGPFGLAVAMTFDDGPNLVTTPSILATLRAENIPATFFVVGRKLETAAEQALALEIHQDPLFRISNHTYDHPRFTTIPIEDARAQVESTSQLIRAAIGDECYFPRYFRFPFGASDCPNMEMIREHGLGVAGVNIDPKDWCYASGGGTCEPSTIPTFPEEYRDDMVGYAVHRLLASQGGIMLMHDVHQNTADELPAVISAFRAAGATFVDLEDTALFQVLNENVQAPEPPACCNGVVTWDSP